MIVLARPRAGPAPRRSTASPAEGSFAPTRCRWPTSPRIPSTSRSSRQWLRSYRPEELFDEQAALRAELAALAPEGERRMGANPHANGGLLTREPRAARLPRPRGRRAGAGARVQRGDARARRASCATSCAPTRIASGSSARTRRAPTGSAPSSRSPTAMERGDPPDRRPPRSGRPRHGGPLRAPLPGLARGLPADRPPRPVQLLRGVHPHRRLDVQPARQVAEGHARASRGGARFRR